MYGFVKHARHQPRKQLLKTNVLKIDERNTQKRLIKKLRSLEDDKADTIEMERLQRRIENIEKSIRKLGDEDKEDKPWSTITGANKKV